MENRCRLCAEYSTEQLNVLEDPELLAKIYQLYSVGISLEDKLPTSACLLCCETVNHAWEFNQHVQKSQEILNEIASSVASPIFNTKLDLATQVDEISLEIHRAESPPQPSKPIECSQEEQETKLPRTRRQTRRRCNDPELSETEDINEDGSVTLRTHLEGWDAYPWTCCECQQLFDSCENLRRHHSGVHERQARYACADCPKSFTEYGPFLGHVKVHRPKLRFCCDICNKWYPTEGFLLDHHRPVVHPPSSDDGDSSDHLADPNATSTTATHHHRSISRSYSCPECGKSFRVQSALSVHRRSHLPPDLKNKHHCDQCPKRFATRPNLMAHQRIHAGVREYTCDQCGKSFVQKGNLDNHLLTHTAARPFACSACGKAFKTLVRLRKHGSVHSGLKPHQCDVCGRSFRERGTLKEHHRIHTGAMPFTCEFCHKSFRFKGILTTHRRQHTGERPYSCQECQHHFTNWPNYNKHMKRRHGINTSVTVRKPQSIPPTGMPHRNPPGTVLAPPTATANCVVTSATDTANANTNNTATAAVATVAAQQLAAAITESFVDANCTAFYPVLNLYNLPEELLQQRVV